MKKLLFLLPLLFLFSCMKNSIHSEMFRGFDENRWINADTKSFEFDITEEVKADIIVKFSHIYEPQYSEVPIMVTLKKPAGDVEVFNAVLVLKDSQGENISDCVGDVCDLEYTLKENYSFEPGTYTSAIANDVKTLYLPNVLGLGFEIRAVAK